MLERINLLEKTVADLRINNADKAFEPKSISSPIEAEFAMKTSIANMVQNNNAISNNSFPNPRISSCISQPTMLTQNISHAYNTQHTTTPGPTYTNPWVTNSMNMQGIPAVFSKPSYPTYTTSVNNAQTTSSYYNTNNLFSNAANPNNVHNFQASNAITTNNLYSHPSDIVALLPEFNPSKAEMNSHQFIKRIEMLKNVYNWKDGVLLFAVQQKLQGPAKLWIDSLQEVFVTWSQFVDKFLNDFPFSVNVSDVHIKMSRTFRERNSSRLLLQNVSYRK